MVVTHGPGLDRNVCRLHSIDMSYNSLAPLTNHATGNRRTIDLYLALMFNVLQHVGG